MRASHLSCALIVLSLLSSCNGNWQSKKRNIVSLEDIPTTEIPMELICQIASMDYEYAAPELHLIDDKVAAFTYHPNASLLRLYDLSGNYITTSVLRNKKDTKAIKGFPTMNTAFSFLHPTTNIHYEYVVEDGNLRIKDYTRMRMGEHSPKQAMRLDDNYFALIGYFKDGLWGLWHKPTQVLNFFGNYPVAQEVVSKNSLVYYDGRTDISGDQLVYVAYQFGYISSYRYKDKKISKLWETQVSDFLFEEENGQLLFDETHKSGFIEVYFAGDNIYTLYNGYDASADENSTNSIMVFSRDNGKPLARYILPEAMNYMKFDSKGEYAYATYTASEEEKVKFNFVRFKLPDLSK